MDKTKIFAAAEKAVLKGQVSKAIEHLNQIVQKDPRDAKALNKLADLYLKENDRSKAVGVLKKVGEIYHRDGFYSKAAAIYKRILKIEDQAPKEELIEVHERLAELYQQLDLASEAMPHFKIVVDYYDYTENRESLLRVLKNISELDPGNLDSQLKLAELFVAQGRQEEAKDLLLRLEETVAVERSLAEAARFYEKRLELFPDEGDAIRKLVETYLSGSEPKRALAVLQKAFRQDPYNAEILELLSETFRRLSQVEKARAVDVELIKIYRKSGEADKVAQVEARVKGETPPPVAAQQSSRKDISEAVDPAEHLMKEGQSSPEEAKVLSECEVYLKYGLIDKAREVLSDQLQNFSKSLALRWKLRQVYLELQDSDAADRMMNELQTLAKEQKNVEWLNVLNSSSSGKAAAPAPSPEKESSPIETPAEDERVSAFATSDEQSEISIVVDEDEPMELQAEVELEPSPEDPNRQSEVLDLSQEMEAPAEEDLVDGEFLLSESDFSQDELKQLGAQLGPDAAVPAEIESPVLELSESEDSEEEPAAIEMTSEEPKEQEALSSDSGEVLADAEFEIRQGLEEIAFFRSQGLDSEAEELLKSLQEKYPEHRDWNLPVNFEASTELPESVKKPEAQEVGSQKKVQLEALGTKMKMTVQEDDREEMDDFFDFAGDLQQEFDEMDGKDSALPVEVRDVFNAFKEGVAQSVSEDDVDTHFDLAIAYREMGLVDDAYKAFELCAKSEKRQIEALYQMGLILRMKEDFDSAKETFMKALQSPKVGNQEKLSLSYELAELYMQLEDLESAKKFFEDVQNLDPQFRDVQERLSKLA